MQYFKRTIEIKNLQARIDKIENELTKERNVSLSLLRLDKLHPEISGNKLFKLYYFLKDAISAQKKIITFGGAYSNHLSATATACKLLGIDCIGIVRGEETRELSHTLLFCREQGMNLEFISRENYKRKDDIAFEIHLKNKFGEHVLIPEGGYSTKGAKGVALISNFYRGQHFTHICCPVGTATTLAGLISSSSPSENVIGFSALKNMTDSDNRIQFLLGRSAGKKYSLINDYNFEGYAKKTGKLISFMNKFYEEFAIPTDFVYTAKMIFGVFDLIKKNYFPAESKVICIHTGGLQGNLSLPTGTLNF